MMTLRPELQTVLALLIARPEQRLDLDTIGEAIGNVAASAAEVDALFTELERHGRVVGDQTSGAVSAVLTKVLATARDLRREHGRVPGADEIAARANIPVAAVRGALLFARIVQR